MTIEKSVLSIVPGLQATALVGKNIKLMKKPTTKNYVKTGVTNILGVGLIGATASQINKLP